MKVAADRNAIMFRAKILGGRLVFTDDVTTGNRIERHSYQMSTSQVNNIPPSDTRP